MVSGDETAIDFDGTSESLEQVTQPCRRYTIASGDKTAIYLAIVLGICGA